MTTGREATNAMSSRIASRCMTEVKEQRGGHLIYAAWKKTPLHYCPSCCISQHKFDWTIMHAKQVHPLASQILIRSCKIGVLVLYKHECAILSDQRGVRLQLVCNGMAADAPQLRRLIKPKAILQPWAVFCQGPPDSANEVVCVYRGVHFTAEWQVWCCL